MTTPEVLLPQSFAVLVLAYGMGIATILAGGLAWCWSGARSGDAAYRRGYTQGYDSGHAAGWIKGVSDAGVLDRLVTLDEATSGLQQDAEFRQAAGERRHRAALAAWRKELGRHG